MSGKIVVTSSYPELSARVRKVAKQLHLDIILVEAVLDDAVHQVKKLRKEHIIDVLVSRGGTAELLKKTLDLPLVDAAPGPFDILHSLVKAKEYSVNLAYFAYPEITDQAFLHQAEEILGIPIRFYSYSNLAELTSQIAKAQQNGCEVIVGGGHRGVRLAAAYGMEGYLIYTSQNTVLRALQQAREISALKQSERERGEKQRQANRSKGLVTHYTFDDLVGESLQGIIEEAKLFSQTEATILLRGESGTGKELFAQSIHAFSSRRNGPFVAVNCAALPENLQESELFGYEEGAFTGAKKGGKMGLFELAREGTLFLDEIGKMSTSVQALLLRALQSKTIRKVGGESLIPVNVRIVAASNEDLQVLVKEGDFRPDLYYRLNVLTLTLPSLKDRLSDIPELAENFFTRTNPELGFNLLSPDFLTLLSLYSWPGNVRELENLLRRYLVLTEGGHKGLRPLENWLTFFPELAPAIERLKMPLHHDVKHHLKVPLPSIGTSSLKSLPNSICSSSDTTLKSLRTAHVEPYHAPIEIQPSTLEQMEEKLIRTLLERCQGNRSYLAAKLGISRTTLWKKLTDNHTCKPSLS